MKIFSSWRGVPEISAYVVRPDNVLINSGKDYYKPDWMEGLEAKPMLVVRVARVAKCVEEQFASRYFKEVSLAVSLRVKELAEGLPPTMGEDFDGSLIRWSRWCSYEELLEGAAYWGEKMLTPQQLTERRSLHFPLKERMAQVLAMLSQYYLLKVGDMILLPVAEESWVLERGEGLFICKEEAEELIYFRIK